VKRVGAAAKVVVHDEIGHVRADGLPVGDGSAELNARKDAALRRFVRCLAEMGVAPCQVDAAVAIDVAAEVEGQAVSQEFRQHRRCGRTEGALSGDVLGKRG